MDFFKKLTFTRRQVLAGTAGLGAVATVGCAAESSQQNTPAQAPKLAIVHTNDSHGHDLLDSESLGLAAAAQLKTDYQEQGYDVLLLDAGDIVQGDVLVNYSNGDVAIDFFNACKYDAVALGNREFDYGQDKIEDYVTAAEFPILSANVFVEATGDPLVTQNVVLTTDSGLKVGVFGLTTPETYTKTTPLLVKGLSFSQGDELYACAQQQADALRAEGVDLVVCLAHLGESAESAPNRAQDVVAHVSGVDLYIDGHDHQEETAWIEDASGAQVLVVETGCYTHAVGVVTWDGETFTPSLMEYGEYDGQDASVAALVQNASDELSTELDILVATTPFYLNGERNPGLRTQETNLGDLVTDAIFWETSLSAEDTPDATIMNAGAIRTSIPAGDITMRDVLNVLPFINYLCTVQVSGAQLLEVIEAACAFTPDENGGFPQVSNMSFEVDTSVPFVGAGQYPDSTYEKPANPGARVTITDVNGRGFSLDDTYTIAAIDFLCAGGDTYYAFAEAASKTMKGTGYLASDAFRYYLEDQAGAEVPSIYEEPQGRIVVK